MSEDTFHSSTIRVERMAGHTRLATRMERFNTASRAARKGGDAAVALRLEEQALSLLTRLAEAPAEEVIDVGD